MSPQTLHFSFSTCVFPSALSHLHFPVRTLSLSHVSEAREKDRARKQDRRREQDRARLWMLSCSDFCLLRIARLTQLRLRCGWFFFRFASFLPCLLACFGTEESSEAEEYSVRSYEIPLHFPLV